MVQFSTECSSSESECTRPCELVGIDAQLLKGHVLDPIHTSIVLCLDRFPICKRMDHNRESHAFFSATDQFRENGHTGGCTPSLCCRSGRVCFCPACWSVTKLNDGRGSRMPCCAKPL